MILCLPTMIKADKKKVDDPLFAKSLKSTWIKKYLDQNNHGKFKLCFNPHLRDFIAIIYFTRNLYEKEFSMTAITDTFQQELLHIWSEITFEDTMVSIAYLRSQPIWFHSLIRIENKPLYVMWATNGF